LVIVTTSVRLRPRAWIPMVPATKATQAVSAHKILNLDMKFSSNFSNPRHSRNYSAGIFRRCVDMVNEDGIQAEPSLRWCS
jgi:hypothetical protein